VPAEQVETALASAVCLVLPSRREGYGLIVVEAAASGTPTVVVSDPDNAATELVEPDVNGTTSPSASPEDLAAAIVRAWAGGAELRAATAAWFAGHEKELSLAASIDEVAVAYEPMERGAGTPRPSAGPSPPR
jgi:glycosyltransferase involved in cell wall biosynthesis